MKYFIFIQIFFWVSIHTNLHGQRADNPINLLKSYNEALENGAFSNELYFKKTDTLFVNTFFRTSGSFPQDQLIQLLEQYKKLAWSDKKFEQYKALYYGHLATNANIQGRVGEAIFYAGKYDEQTEKLGNNSFLKNIILFKHYQSNKNYIKAIEFFEQNEQELYSFSIERKLTPEDQINQITIFGVVIEAYLYYEKTSRARELITKLRKFNELVQKSDQLGIYSKTMAYVQTLVPEIQLSLALNLHQKANKDITDGLKHLNANKKELAGSYNDFMNVLSNLKVDYLTRVKKYKEASTLLSTLRPDKYLFGNDSLFLSLKEANLQANMGSYREAYLQLETALNNQNKRTITLTNELDGLLYSHAEAEYNRNELEYVQSEKKIQLLWMLGIGLSLTVLLVASALFRIREKRKTRAALDHLNQLTDVMVEEARKEAAKEEKRKLGQDLHDDLSGSLASLLHVIKRAESQTQDKNTAGELERIFERTGLVYERIRTKSHLLYDLSENNENDFLGQNIRKIVDTALPDKDFTKEVEIDPSVSILLSSAARIEVLRIVQEAINNILKHARKASDIFVFLYKEADTVTLQISDNGKSAALPPNRKGIGLHSIADRVQKLGGQLKIDTQSGMNLTILFPLA